MEIDRIEIGDQKQSILAAFPRAKTLISFVCRMNAAQIQSQDRSLADGEFIALDAEMLRCAAPFVVAAYELYAATTKGLRPQRLQNAF